MREHVQASKMLSATGTGSVLAAVLTSSAFAVGNALNGADGIGFLFVVRLIVGIPVAIVGVPVGFVLF
jgi:hypothetical protein